MVTDFSVFGLVQYTYSHMTSVSIPGAYLKHNGIAVGSKTEKFILLKKPDALRDLRGRCHMPSGVLYIDDSGKNTLVSS